jgi:hypothetical protein
MAAPLRRTFLDGYRDVAVRAGLTADAAALDGEAPLLRLFELEKAFYELRYELNNRPDWVAVPLEGLAAWPESGARAKEKEHRCRISTSYSSRPAFLVQVYGYLPRLAVARSS